MTRDMSYMIQQMHKDIRILSLFAALFFGAVNEVLAAENINSDNVVVEFNAGHGGITKNVAGRVVTLTVTPNSGFFINRSDIKVQKLVDPSLARTRNAAPVIADYLPVSGPNRVMGTESKTFTFTIPEGYQGALVNATFQGADNMVYISSTSSVSDPSKTYILTEDVSASVFSGLASSIFTGELDGNGYTISNLSSPLFASTENAIIMNVMFSGVGISSGTDVGAITGEAKGSTRIYNCGVLATPEYDPDGNLTGFSGSSVSGSGNVGGLVGTLSDNARVINCFSYATIKSGDNVGGIVGYNSVASSQDNVATMVMNCMFYGDIEGGSSVSPVYGGENINNVNIVENVNKGLSTFNYYAYSQLKTKDISEGKYNSALAMEERFLNRCELYRQLLNSNKKLAAFYATGSAENADQMMKWVLETADRQISNPMPYPVLRKREQNKKYPSVINYDADHASQLTLVNGKIKEEDRNKGGKISTLSVTIKAPGDWTNAPTGAKLLDQNGNEISSSRTISLVRTDKDYNRFNFNYDKVQLPYYNDYGTKNYTGQKVVTGWKITNITPGGGEGDATQGSYTADDSWGGYNFADRKTYAKDLYSGLNSTDHSGRVFSQGAYFDVPYGVTSITIEPYWGNAVYVGDETLDIVYTDAYATPTRAADVQFTNGTSTYNSQKVYTTTFNANGTINKTAIANALAAKVGGTTILNGSEVYDNAIVLVGNLHLNGVPSSGNTKFTIMSVDDDHDNEPDYSLIYHHDNRVTVSPIRFDFLNVVGTAMAQKPNNAVKLYNVGIFNPKGWFEVTNTCSMYFTQFEADNLGKTAAPVIFLGGVIDQYTSTKDKNIENVEGNYYHKTQYIHLGSNACFKDFGNGTHSDGWYATRHVPVSVTGGDFNGFYLSGVYRPDAQIMDDDAEGYISGGRFKEMAGAAQQMINGSVRFQIYDADITNFYGGGINAEKPITGNVTVDIFNSHVGTYCGGPKFGDMQKAGTTFTTKYSTNKAGSTTGTKEIDIAEDGIVTTNATGCTFDKFFGAGYGGASYYKLKYYDQKDLDFTTSTGFSTLIGNYNGDRGKYYDGNTSTYKTSFGNKGPGVATDFDYEFFVWSTGEVGARFYVNYTTFSLAKTNNVNSTLTNCIINDSFYGGGSYGKVDGTATSKLDGCTVYGNVFGGGYSASIPSVPVRATGFEKIPFFNKNAGIFDMGKKNGTTNFKWNEVETLPANNADALASGNIPTKVDIDALGQVDHTVLTISGDTYVKGDIHTYNNNGDIIKTEQIGGVFGGGDESTVNGNTKVDVQGTATSGINQGINNVYGGGNTADVLGDALISVTGGKMVDVYGGGRGEITVVKGDVTVHIGKSFKEDGTTVDKTGTPTISGSVYGGSALGVVNAASNKDSDGKITSYTPTVGKTTNVNLYGGTIAGDLYGGGLGKNESETKIAADVYGPVTVTVEGGTATNVFGCNNVYGTPKETVEVTINGTAATVVNEGVKAYALQGVYGGGNLAHYNPTNPSTYPTVTVNGCSTSIKDVFGGGNAAAVPYTNVTINGGDIDRVFAGGNGESGTPAHVGYMNTEATPTENSYGAGTASALIAGGTINQVFGGSNANGTIRVSSSINVNKSTAEGACDMKIGELYGGGNLAAGTASTLTIGCTGSIVEGENGHAAHPELIGTSLEGIGAVYGGANQADVSGNISLAINSGIVANVFGGNNTSGTISGTIAVDIEKTNDGCGWYVGNVFGGGNLATYTGSPVVNIKNGTVSGNVYGGGAGELVDGDQRGVKGKVTGNPQVTIGDDDNNHTAIVLGDVYGGGDAADVAGTPVIIVNDCNTRAGAVYGGGNAADVSGSTITINGGTIGDAFGGGHGDKDASEPSKYADVNGNVTFNVYGGTIGRVFAGSNSRGQITGTSALTVNKTGSCAMKIGEVYGGGNEAAGAASTITIGCTGDLVAGENGHLAHPENIGTTLEGIGYVYGGANQADVTSGNISLTINSGIVANVFGGNNTSGNISGTIIVNIEKNDAATCASNWYVGNVYGGGNQASYRPTTAGAYPEVNIKNGTVSGSVFGGGLGATAKVYSNPKVTIGDITEGHESYVATVAGDVYGGGSAAMVGDNAGETASINNTTVLIQKANSSVANVFGGGMAASVTGTTSVTIAGGTVSTGVYGGCNTSGSVGAVTIALNGGQVGTDATHRADVYGGGYGHPTTTTGDVTVNVGTATTSEGTTTYSGSAVIYGDVYGGSALGQVNGSSSTTTLNINSNSIHGTIYGGGMGSGTGDDTKATTNGNIQINYNTANTDLAGFYGGANANGNVVGNIEVNIKANIGASGAGNGIDLFGGGLGAATSTNGNITVNIGDLTLDSSNDPVYNPVVYGNIYGGSSLGSVNDAVADLTTVNILSGTIYGNTYGGGLGEAGTDNVTKGQVNGTVIVNIGSGTVNSTTGFATATNGFATFVAANDGSSGSIYGCNNTNGSPKGNVTVNVYQTAHTTTDEASYTGNTPTYAIDQVFGGGNQANYSPTSGDSRATIHVYTCDNTIRRVFGGGNAAAAVGVVTQIDGGHFDYVYGGGNGEVTAANIGAGGTNLQIHGGKINYLFGGSNAQGTITGNMGVSVDNNSGCGGTESTQYVNEFFCGNNLASIGTAQNPVTINATIACGTRFGAVYGGCNLAPLYGSVNLTVEGGVMDYVYGGSKGRLADNSDPTNLIQALAADISGDVTLTIKGGQIKNVFGGSNINGNIAGSIEVNIEKDDASTCNDGWYVGNVYGASNLAAYTPNDGKTLKVNIKNGTVNGNVYGGGKGESAIVTSNPVVTIGDVTAGHERYVAKVEDKDGDTEADGTTAMVGGNVYGGGDAAPVVGNTTVTYNDNNASTTVANIFGGGNNASVSGNATVTLKGKATVEQNVFGGGNKGIVQGKATVNIEE